MGAFASTSLTTPPARRPRGTAGRLFRIGLVAGALLETFAIGLQVGQVYGLTIPVPWPRPHPAPSLPPLPGPPPADLASRTLTVPVQGVAVAALVPSFSDARSGGRVHLAIDILAPRNTPVLAADEGSIAGVMRSGLGGLTVYQYDAERKYCYYYAHLERYADGLVPGQTVRRGQVLGYVGTSGNAPENVPHLHFAIHRLTDPARWSQGTPVDPYPVLRAAASGG